MSLERTRRRVLAGIGTGIGALGLVGAAGGGTRTATAESDSGAPSVAWRRTYHGGEQEYDNSIYGLVATSDGGYALAGSGQPIRETGPEEEQFSLLKADDGGEQQWISFADDGLEDTEQTAGAVVETADGGYAVVGYALYPDDPTHDHRANTSVAQVARFSTDGDVSWFRTLDAYEEDDGDDDRADPGGDDDALFRAAAPSPGGGVVAAGRRDGHAWAAKFAPDGSVEWHADHEDVVGFHQAHATDGGYLLGGSTAADGHTEYHAVHLDDSGTIQRTVTFDIDYDTVTYNHVMIPSAHGGYALTGRHANHERMVLVEADGDGNQQWLETYNGPYDGNDWAFDVVRTDDGGYAIAGYMSAAYSGDQTPTVLKTDADGTEQWRLLDEESDGSDARPLVRTDDGGYAYLGATNTLVKLSPDDDGDRGTETATPSDSPSDADGSSDTSSDDDSSDSDSNTDGSSDSDSDADASSGSGSGSDDSSGSGSDSGTSTATPTDTESDDGTTAPGTPTATGTGTGSNDGQAGTGTAGGGPGFGIVATVGGLASAAAYYLRSGDEPEV